MYKRFSIIMLAVALSSCGTPQQKASALEENKEAKSLLEGIWLDDNTETALLRVKGDTLFYADAATAPVAFKIIGDSLITYGARTNGYKIEKQEEHIFLVSFGCGRYVCISLIQRMILWHLSILGKSLFITKLLRKIRW